MYPESEVKYINVSVKKRKNKNFKDVLKDSDLSSLNFSVYL